ncbi:MAG TPA: ABC transporter ATP-binding protein [Nitrospirae bacterium]|nr:ABC transporter ATP-binding protein [Nitrospirota bacterium]HDZ03390.1 ABC transporter ATP-binding protein [Nitrospirota bacterium]
MNEETPLQVKNISVRYNGVRALKGVSLRLDPGEIVALMGPNGAGKSTILKAIFGLAPIDSGEVLWHGKQVIPVTYRIAKLGIAFIPQGRRVFRHLNVEENLEMGGFLIDDKNILQRRIENVMDIFPVLRRKRKAQSGTLSGGEQQMLAIARGLVTDPKVLLLDEPSLGLAPKIVKEVFQKIREINAKRKTTVMVVEHNIKSVLDIADRAYVLDKGKIVAHGESFAFLESDILERVFLGR